MQELITIVNRYEFYKKKVDTITINDEYKLENSFAVYEMLKKFDYHLRSEEVMIIIVLNNQCQMIGVFEGAVGSNSICHIDMKNIFKKILLMDGTGFIVAHNHPGGSNNPSQADKISCKNILIASKLLDIAMLDNLIITETGYFSFASKDILE